MSAARLTGRRIVVTGASTGIGRAVALACAREGARVVVNYAHNAQAAAETVALARREGADALALPADVSDAAAVEGLVRDSAEWLGGLDGWCNVAGADILTGAGARLTRLEKLARLIDVDLRGTMLCSWAASEMLGSNAGAIVNTSWDQALTGMGGENPGLFAAVKGGVTAFSRSLSRTLAPRVRVNEVAPGWIATAFAQREMREDYHRAVVEATPLGRFGTPEDVAAAFVFLLSAEAAFITGQTLNVNGGLVCG
jgi:3-oxoacyl-[acyl-carrier protein] reductase